MKAKGISTKQVQEFINNEEERFNDQPAITDNGDSKATSISYEGKKLSFDWFDSFRNFRCGVTDKDRKEIIEIFYSFLQDILCKNEFCQQEGNTSTYLQIQ
jgi:hypothetical protein